MSFVIKNTDQKENTFLNMVIYGHSGVGKTSLASTVQNALVISIEDGVLSLSGKGVDYVEVSTYKSVKELVRAIKNNTDGQFDKYEWLFIDSITDLGQRYYPILRDKMDAAAIADNKKGSHGMKIWGAFGEHIGSLIREVRSLKMHTVILALSEQKEINGISKRSPDIYGKSAERIIAWLDECFYMHITDKGERFLLTEATNVSHAKDRSGKLDKLEKPNLNDIKEKILK